MEARSPVDRHGGSLEACRSRQSEEAGQMEMNYLNEAGDARSTQASSLITATQHFDDYAGEAQPIVSRSQHPDYTPLALRVKTLISFAIIFAILAIALAGLYWYSKVHQGFVTLDENWNYVFKYGPTVGESNMQLDGKCFWF